MLCSVVSAELALGLVQTHLHSSELAQVELAAVWEAQSLPGVAVMISVLIHLPSCRTGAALAEK